MVLKSLGFSLVCAGLYWLARTYLHTELYVIDVGGLSSFLSVFGTLYGILAAFVVFEVWSQYNRISSLIGKEAQSLEQLFRLSLYFRDQELTARMKAGIREYINYVVEGNFRLLAKGERNAKSGLALRKISEVIQSVEFDDDHDAIVFEQIVEHYGAVAQLRTERTNESRNRLPRFLKYFIYIASGFALVTFLLMPFEVAFYGHFSAFVIGFLQAMVFQLIEELDNPFRGHMQLTPAPFSMALKHIEEDY
ncbi:MAG: DUF4239 domain-containing protein [Anaerolineales bacterium]|nr:MAG: DUF4239 domain-containing protein [Anaerolineales bacterium]